MSKFVIECPACHNYAEARKGFFASKHITCTCGNVINVKTDKMTSRVCPSCGNTVLYDQSKGTKALCPVCKAQLVSSESFKNLISFRCRTCGCQLQADKSAKEISCPVCDSINDVQSEVKLYQEKRSGLPSVIRYEGDNQTFVWKHPVTDFVIGTQLIVHESQEAIFFRNGEALDTKKAGIHTLETGVLPKMESLYPLPINGQPFHAEVYYVNLTTHFGIKWGTSSKMRLRDPASGLPVELGASGAFNLQVSDSRRLVIRMVGTTDILTRSQVYGYDMNHNSITGEAAETEENSQENQTSYFRTLIMTKVKSILPQLIKTNAFSVIELDEHLDEISIAIRDAINPDLAEYGLSMPEFYVSNILLPDDDPNIARLKQQHADRYLLPEQERIRKSEAEEAAKRKIVETETNARIKILDAQGEAERTRIMAQADADAYRIQAEAEAQEMKMKGYSYQQETARQVGIEAMKNNSSTAPISGFASDLMHVGVGLGTVGSVLGMAKDAMQPIASMTQDAISPRAESSNWDCPTCGLKGIESRFCPNCGSKRLELVLSWNCPNCKKQGIVSNFCPDCGCAKPSINNSWKCPSCGANGITSKFCPDCGYKKEE